MSGQFDLDRWITYGGATGLALLVEHLLCYDEEQFNRNREAVLAGSNILGVTTVAIGYGFAKRSVRAGFEVWLLAAFAGIIVIGIRYARYDQRIRSTVDFLAGRIIERIQEAQRNDQGYARNGSRDFRA